ncbi:MAG TPA: hypothetical protein VGI92_12560 [Gemmatimonadales bacterium]|jgi:hypothetical protein
MRQVLGIAAIGMLAGVAACTDYVTQSGAPPAPPTGLTYELEPSGDPTAPSGIILRWNAENDPNLSAYNVYSRADSTAPYDLRASTTSPSFHDDGKPDLQYRVTAEAQDQAESDPSASITVDERLRLPAPTALTSISLNAAIHLDWTDNAYLADPAGFWHYRIYSTSYDLDHNACGTSWSLEGTTVAPTFLVGAMANGQPRCFGISAVTIEGFESLWSPLRNDTPRPDAKSQIVFTQAGDALHSGFRFFLDANNDGQASPLELGIITTGSSPQIDFTITNVGGVLQLAPVRSNTQVQMIGTTPVTDITDIDIAPVSGYSHAAVPAQPGFGYVFQMDEGDGFYRYGALRVVALGTNYVVFDWSYQTDPGNPELLRQYPVHRVR